MTGARCVNVWEFMESGDEEAGMRVKKIGKMNQRGMTLVEVLVAVAILAVVIIPTLHIFASTSATNLRSRQRQRATSVAEGTMESFKAYNLEQLCKQFASRNFPGVEYISGTTSMGVEAVYNPDSPSPTYVNPFRTDDTRSEFVDNADLYMFKVRKTASEGQYYDVDIYVTPAYAPGNPDVQKMDDANAYSDAIITDLGVDFNDDALDGLKDMAAEKWEDNFPYPSAVSKEIVETKITNFHRVIDLEVNDNGRVQTVTMKVTCTGDAEVKYKYKLTAAASEVETSVTYSDLELEVVLNEEEDAAEPKVLTVFDNTAIIDAAEGDGLDPKLSKLNQIYLYYFPAYSEQCGSGAKDEINISGNLTDLYDRSAAPGVSGPTANADSRALGYGSLKVCIAKQAAAGLSEVELSNSEATYQVTVNNTVNGGVVELRSNLTENLSSIGDIEVAPPIITNFASTGTIREALSGRVPLLYNVDIRVYEAGTPEEEKAKDAADDYVAVAKFSGTMNE